MHKFLFSFYYRFLKCTWREGLISTSFIHDLVLAFFFALVRPIGSDYLTPVRKMTYKSEGSSVECYKPKQRKLIFFTPVSHFYIPWKRLVFWLFQGVWQWDIGVKGVNLAKIYKNGFPVYFTKQNFTLADSAICKRLTVNNLPWTIQYNLVLCLKFI